MASRDAALASRPVGAQSAASGGLSVIEVKPHVSLLAAAGANVVAHGGRDGHALDGQTVLQAYDGVSGKALWNSGTTSAAPDSYWSALSQVYVGTDDGTVYAFGFDAERR